MILISFCSQESQLSQIRYTILALYKLVCMYVCIQKGHGQGDVTTCKLWDSIQHRRDKFNSVFNTIKVISRLYHYNLWCKFTHLTMSIIFLQHECIKSPLTLPWEQGLLRTHTHTHKHNRFTALFPGPSGWASARWELLDFMVQGKINTDHLAGRHSIRTKQCPPPLSPHVEESTCFIVSKSYLWNGLY